MNIIIQYPKVTQSAILFNSPSKSVSSLLHCSCPDHLFVLDVIINQCLVRNTNCVFPDVAGFCSWLFRFYVLRIYQIFRFHQIFKVLPRNVTTFVIVLPRINKFYCICGGSTYDWSFITFVKDFLNIQILHVCYEFIKDSNFATFMKLCQGFLFIYEH